MHDLLEPLAPEVDVDAGWAAVVERLPGERRRRALVRGVSALALVALVAGAAALVVRSGSRSGEDGSVVAGPTTSAVTPATPPEPAPTLSAAIPPGWAQAEQNLTPFLIDPHEVLTVGTGSLPVGTAQDCGIAPGRALAEMGPADALVWVTWAGPVTRPPVPPPPLAAALPTGRERLNLIGSCVPEGFAFDQTTASIGGQPYFLLVVLGPEVTDDTRSETVQVLDSLAPVSVDVPPGWEAADRSLTPDLEDPREVVAVGTYPLRPGGPCAHVPGNALADLPDDGAFVWIATDSGPTAETPLEELVLPSPPTAETEIGACTPGAGPSPDFLVSWGRYERDGESVYALVAFGLDATEETQLQAIDIVNSLRFS